MAELINILLIEDDGDDVELLQEALRSQGVLYSMNILTDGKKALDHIQTCTDCPDIIILDFNLPKVHGREVLQKIKASAAYKNIPLLILTTSSMQEDLDFAVGLGADAFIVKPTTMEEIKKTVQKIEYLAKKY